MRRGIGPRGLRLDRLVGGVLVRAAAAVLVPALLVLLLPACELPPETLPARDAGVDAAPPDAGAGALAIRTRELPRARYGGVYEALLEATGGQAPLAWEVARGALPRGAYLQGSGALVAPSVEEEGVFGFVARVTDAAGAQDERALVLVVDRALTVVTTVLPRAYQDHAYDQPVVAAGGQPPYGFAVVGGALPGALVLTEDGRVVGDPGGEADASFRVAVSDAAGARAEGEVSLSVYGPFVVVERAVRDLEFCFARRFTTLPVRPSFELARVRVVVRLEAHDVSRLVVTVVSPSGTEVYLTTGGLAGDAIDTVFGDETETAEPLDALAGENAAGTWTVTLYDPRCPYPAVLDEVALVLEPREGPEESLVARGWTASLEAGRPSVRVAGGGLDQSVLDLTVERYGPGPNGAPEGGKGDDEWLGTAAATWSTTLAPEAATVSPAGQVVAGAQTGQGTLTWDVDGRRATLPLVVLPPDWVP